MEEKTFNSWLLGHVKESGLSRPKIARSIGCSKPALDKWLSGENTPKVTHLLSLCHLLFEPEEASMYYLYASNLLGDQHVDSNTEDEDPRATGPNGAAQI